MELKSTFSWDVGEMAEKRKAAGWRSLKPTGLKSPPTARSSIWTGELLCCSRNVRRYEAALLRIAEKPDEQKALMEHREKTGQEVPASDLQRFFAYLDVAHIAGAALGKEP